MNKHAIIQVLEYVNHFDLFISLARVKKYVLDNAKLKRKELTKKEIIEKGLNIYPKSEIKIDDLIENLIGDDYIEVKQTNEIEIRLSPMGSLYLMELYTDGFSDTFLSYKNEVNNLTLERNETDFNPVHIGAMFYYKTSLKEIEKTYFTDKSLQEQVQKYHNYMIDKYELKPNGNDYIFHLMPKLFLPIEDMEEDVELFIKGIDLPEQPIILDRPYPNQRYVVGGIKLGKERITTGFYPIIASKNEFPHKKNICYHWKLGNGKEIIHDIHIQFEFDRGQLFSTEQSLNRSNDISNYCLATFIEDAPPYNSNNRTIEYLDKNNKILHLNEKVVLTSFPAKLHNSFHPDKYYEKWVVKTTEKGEIHV